MAGARRGLPAAAAACGSGGAGAAGFARASTQQLSQTPALLALPPTHACMHTRAHACTRMQIYMPPLSRYLNRCLHETLLDQTRRPACPSHTSSYAFICTSLTPPPPHIPPQATRTRPCTCIYPHPRPQPPTAPPPRYLNETILDHKKTFIFVEFPHGVFPMSELIAGAKRKFTTSAPMPRRLRAADAAARVPVRNAGRTEGRPRRGPLLPRTHPLPPHAHEHIHTQLHTSRPPGTLCQAIWPSFNIYSVAASSVFSVPFWCAARRRLP